MPAAAHRRVVLRLLLVLPVLTLSPLLSGCGEPLYVGVAAARAAGRPVPTQPAAFPPPRSAAGALSAGGSSAGAPPAPAKGLPDGVLHLPTPPQPAAADELVGLRLQHDGTMAARPLTFGQVFARGQLPRGSSVVARADGREVPTQLDIKASYADGSAKMGVVTVLAAAPADLMLLRRATPAAPPLDLAAAAPVRGMTVTLALHDGASRQFDLGALLDQGLRAGTVSWWLRGKLAAEARVEAPVQGSLRLTADIRAYADGSGVVDLQFNNDRALIPDGGALRYAVTVRQGGRVLFEQPELTHHQYQTWHTLLWSAGDPGVNVVHDVAAMARAGAIQNYDLGAGVSARVLAAQTRQLGGPDFAVLGSAGVTRSMGMTGGRPDIGPVTLANSIWLMTQHPDAARFALAQADAAGSVPWHFLDPATGTYVQVDRHPKLWTDYRGGQWDTKGLTQPIDGEGTGWLWDNSHQPELSYIPYLMTGSRYRLDQLNAQAAASIVAMWPTARQDGQGLVVNNIEQVRGRAWAFRDILEAAFIDPDDAPLLGYFRQVVRNCIAFLQAEARARTKGEAYGWFRDIGPFPNEGGVTSPWMQDFLGSTLVLAATQEVPGARELVVWQAHFLAGRFLAADKGFPPRNGTAYRLNMYPVTEDAPYLTWREIQADSLAHGFAKDGSVWGSEDGAYIQAARGVLGGIVSVTGLPEARRALEWLDANAPHLDPASLRDNPTWNIVPR